MNFFPVRFDRFHGKIRSSRVAAPSHSQGDGISEDGSLSLIVEHGRVVLSLQESQLKHWENRERLAQRLCQILEDVRVRVLRIDMSGIRGLDGEALAQFARVHCKASQLGKQIVLENVCDAIREIFHVTRFDRMVGLADDRGVRNLASWAADTVPLTQVRR